MQSWRFQDIPLLRIDRTHSNLASSCPLEADTYLMHLSVGLDVGVAWALHPMLPYRSRKRYLEKERKARSWQLLSAPAKRLTHSQCCRHLDQDLC